MPFQKGQSGNPNGRPKGTTKVPTNKQIKDAFKRNTNKALTELLDCMEHGSREDRFKASVKILDTVYNIIKEEEKLKISKAKKGDQEDDEEDYDTPEVSIKAVESKK